MPVSLLPPGRRHSTALSHLCSCSLEFDFALEWRQLLGQLQHAKRGLCLEQAADVAEQLSLFQAAAAGGSKGGAAAPAPVQRERLLLPGERLGAAGGQPNGGSGSGPPPSCGVWLEGVPSGTSEEALVEAFGQFGHPQQALLVRDPVLRRLPASHAVLFTESERRARDVVQARELGRTAAALRQDEPRPPRQPPSLRL